MKSTKSISVLTLQNGKNLNKSQFISYFEKKVLYTIKKYDLLKEIKKKRSSFDIKELFKNKIGPIHISHECLDDISLLILEIFMSKPNIKKAMKRLMPKKNENKKITIRPFYFMTKNEIKIYAKLKNIDFKTKKEKRKSKSEVIISSWLDDFEKKHLEVKNALVMSLLKIEENSARLRSTNESCHHH